VIFVDSNVIIDVLDCDPEWYDWSLSQMIEAAAHGKVVTNHVVLAETAPHYGSLSEFNTRLEEMTIEIEALTDHASFNAGMAFLEYRKRNKDRQSVLADFLIGGHAQALEAAILTRDPRVYRTYFPSVRIITPDKADT
jgi:predicted nucleic acid-binding protein